MDLGVCRSFHLGNDMYHAIASHAFNFVGFVERVVQFEHWNGQCYDIVQECIYRLDLIQRWLNYRIGLNKFCMQLSKCRYKTYQ